jgi:hypothetical protein
MSRCLRCGSETRNNKYCSRNCAAAVNNVLYQKRPSPAVRQCLICGEETTNQKYCSMSCAGKGAPRMVSKKPRLCIICEQPTKNKKYCSARCTGVATRKTQTKAKWSSARATDRSTMARRIEISDNEIEAMKEAQGHKCPLCLIERKLVKDHCHETGLIRGLICRGCNSALGVFGDNEEGLLRALDYLRTFEATRERRLSVSRGSL